MKRPLFIFSALITGMFVFSSCNKNLKDDIKDLQRQNSEMQEKLNGIANALGTDEPITATTTFKDFNNATVTITDTYRFKSAGISTQSLIKEVNGDYEVYIERFGDVEWYEGAWVAFRYNPTTKAITRKRGGQYWEDAANYNSNARYDENEYNTGLTFNVNIKSIDLTTGTISVEVTMSGTEEYSNNVAEWSVPRRGTAVSTTFSFDGKLKPFVRAEPI